jgi:hypothetical protein
MFPTASAASANVLSASLEEAVRVDRGCSRAEAAAKRRRLESEAQDFGASVVLIFGAPAVMALAKALHAWLVRNSGVTITLRTPSGEALAENLDSKDAAATAAAITAALSAKSARRSC